MQLSIQWHEGVSGSRSLKVDTRPINRLHATWSDIFDDFPLLNQKSYKNGPNSFDLLILSLSELYERLLNKRDGERECGQFIWEKENDFKIQGKRKRAILNKIRQSRFEFRFKKQYLSKRQTKNEPSLQIFQPQLHFHTSFERSCEMRITESNRI